MLKILVNIIKIEKLSLKFNLIANIHNIKPNENNL